VSERARSRRNFLAGALPGRPRRVGGAGLAAGPPRQRKSGDASIPPRLNQPQAPVTGFLCFTIGRKKAADPRVWRPLCETSDAAGLDQGWQQGQKTSESFASSDRARTADKIGAFAGVSGRTVEKIAQIPLPKAEQLRLHSRARTALMASPLATLDCATSNPSLSSSP
jgi:hypothetical protein